jgi:phospholipid/cholesterol/gamma-HCH transport system substrate-binding protein
VRGVVAMSLLIAVGVVVYLLAFGGSSYRIQAYFLDAGGLVSGGQVRLDGRTVGSISGIGLTPDGQADVTLAISDGADTPLHLGTEASIRAVGLVGVTNDYVDLTPGPSSAPALPQNSVIPTTRTTGIVSLDEVLDAFDPATRSALQQFIGNSAQIYAGSGSTYFSQMLDRLTPALQGTAAFATQIASDQADLQRFVSETALGARAIASRDGDLAAAVSNTAHVFSVLASARSALADSFVHAPEALAEADRTLADTRTAVTALTPALEQVPAAADALHPVLQALQPTLGALTPELTTLVRLLPGVRRSLEGFVPLRRSGVTALDTTERALKSAMPILAGLRIYGPDFLLGIFNGLVGISTAPYDASGHYVHLEFTGLLSSHPLVPGVLALRTGLNARCPGGSAPPAADGSSPWIPDKSLCDPADDTPASVNVP